MDESNIRKQLIEEINLNYDEGKDDEIEDRKQESFHDYNDYNGSNKVDNNLSFYDYNVKSTSMDDEEVVMLSLVEHISKSTLEEEQLKRVMKESKMEAEAINRSLGDKINEKRHLNNYGMNKATSFYDLRKKNSSMKPMSKEMEYDLAMKEAIKKSLADANNKFDNMVSIQPSKNFSQIRRVDSDKLFDLAVEEALKRSLEEVADTMSEENIRNINNYFKSNKSFDLDVEFALRRSIENAAKYNVNIGIDSNYFDKAGLSDKKDRPVSLHRIKGSFSTEVEEALKATLLEATNGLSEEKLLAANNYLRHKKSFDYRLEESLRKSMMITSDINKICSPEDGMKRSKSYTISRSTKKSSNIGMKDSTFEKRLNSVENFHDPDNWGITIDSCTASIQNSSIYTSSMISSQTSSPSKRKSGSFYEPTLPTVAERVVKNEISNNETEKTIESELEDPAVKRFMEQREIKRQSLKAEALRKAFEEEAKRLQIDQSVLFQEATKLKVETTSSDKTLHKKGDVSMSTKSPVVSKVIPTDLSAATNSVLKLISKEVSGNQPVIVNFDNNINKNSTSEFKKSFYKYKSFSFTSSKGSFTYGSNSSDDSDNDTDYGVIMTEGDFEVENKSNSNDKKPESRALSPPSDGQFITPNQSNPEIYNNDSFENVNVMNILTLNKSSNSNEVVVQKIEDKNKINQPENSQLKEKISSKSIFNNFYDPVGFYSMKSPTFSSAGQSSISFNGYSSCNNIYEKALNQATHKFINENTEQALSPIQQESSALDIDLSITNNGSNSNSDIIGSNKYNNKKLARFSDVSSFNNEAATDAEESQMTPFTKESESKDIEMSKDIALSSALTILQEALQNPKVLRDDAIQSAVKVLEKALKISNNSNCSSKSTSIDLDQRSDDRIKDKKSAMVTSAISLLQNALGDKKNLKRPKSSTEIENESNCYFYDDLDDDNIIMEPTYTKMKNLTTRLPKNVSREFKEYSPEMINNNIQKSSSSEIFNKPKTLNSKRNGGKKVALNFTNVENNHCDKSSVSHNVAVINNVMVSSNENYKVSQPDQPDEIKENVSKFNRADIIFDTYVSPKEKDIQVINSLQASSSVNSFSDKLGESFSSAPKKEFNRPTTKDIEKNQNIFDNKINTSQEKLNYRPNSERLNNRYGSKEQLINFNEYHDGNYQLPRDKSGIIDGLTSRDFLPTTSSSYNYSRFDNNNKNEKMSRIVRDSKLYYEPQFNEREDRISTSYSRSREKNFINRNDPNNYFTRKNLINNQDKYEQSFIPTIDNSFDFIDSQCPPFQSNFCTNISPASSITEDSMDFEIENRHYRPKESEIIRSNNFSKSKSVEKLYYKKNNSRKSNDIDSSGFWNCYVCTLQNKPTFLTCEACNAVKKNVI